MIRIDTNYIIRYLVNDNIKMADIAEEILTTKKVERMERVEGGTSKKQ